MFGDFSEFNRFKSIRQQRDFDEQQRQFDKQQNTFDEKVDALNQMNEAEFK